MTQTNTITNQTATWSTLIYNFLEEDYFELMSQLPMEYFIGLPKAVKDSIDETMGKALLSGKTIEQAVALVSDAIRLAQPISSNELDEEKQND